MAVKSLTTVAVALVALGLVSGCAPVRAHLVARPPATPTPVLTSPPATPTPSAAPTAAPVAQDPTVLFTINATATATNSAEYELTYVVHMPTASPTLLTSDLALLNTQCKGTDWPAKFPNPEFLIGDITSTVVPNRPAWPEATGGMAAGADGGNVAYYGSWSIFDNPCGIAALAGTSVAHSVTPVPGSDPESAPDYGWAARTWGFARAIQDNDGIAAHQVKFTCSMTIGPAGQGNALLLNWQAHPDTDDNNGCLFQPSY
jgi:hypothetical protein